MIAALFSVRRSGRAEEVSRARLAMWHAPLQSSAAAEAESAHPGSGRGAGPGTAGLQDGAAIRDGGALGRAAVPPSPVVAPGWRASLLAGLPPAGMRFADARRGVLGLLAAAVLAALAVGAGLWLHRPAPALEPPAVLAAPSTAPATTAAPAPLVVSVVGKVRRPGLVTVPSGSRVADALKAAGGALPGVDLTSVNLARRLTDGEQVVVGAPSAGSGPGAGGSSGAGPGAATTGPVSLNTATLEQLDSLPGVGPVLAQRILDYRTAHNGFTSVDQLRDVDGIGDRIFDKLKPLVTL